VITYENGRAQGAPEKVWGAELVARDDVLMEFDVTLDAMNGLRSFDE